MFKVYYWAFLTEQNTQHNPHYKAGLVERPEDYVHGAFALRAKNLAQHLCDLRPLLGERTKAKAFEQYRSQVYARGSVPSKESDAVLPAAGLGAEMERNFNLGAKDEAREHFRFYKGLPEGFIKSDLKPTKLDKNKLKDLMAHSV